MLTRFLLFLSVSVPMTVPLDHLVHAQQPITFEFDSTNATATLHSRDASLVAILGIIRERTGIRVVVPDPQDRRISVSATRVPLDSLVRQLLQPGTRYWMVAERGDVALPNRDAARTRPPFRVAGDKPRKGAADTKTPGPRQRPPGKVRLFVSDGTRGTMGPPGAGARDTVAAADIPEDRGSRLGRYGRIHFRMIGERVVPLNAAIIEGRFVYSGRLLGGFLYAVRINRQLVAVESFQDPLAVHVYHPDPQRPHEVSRADSGEFSVTIPGIALDSLTASGVTITIYRVVGTPPVSQLTPETFPRFEDVLRKLQVVAGRDIVDLFPTLRR